MLFRSLEHAPIRWIVDDCAKFVEREIRRGRKYDGVIMDPPSYGRGPSGEVWKLEENLYPFVELVSGVLSDNPLFFLISSYTTGIDSPLRRGGPLDPMKQILFWGSVLIGLICVNTLAAAV